MNIETNTYAQLGSSDIRPHKPIPFVSSARLSLQYEFSVLFAANWRDKIANKECQIP